MSLITVYGSNPFAGQSDPYLSMDSTIEYEDNPEGTIINTYILNGVITGCSLEDLSTIRDNLVRSFDWESDQALVENIKIEGVVEAGPKFHLIPSTLSFEASNYIGALPYSLNLEVFTGAETGREDFISKTHTVTTDITEEGCINMSTNISCDPNPNLTGCGALEAANKWISGQLGANVKLGAITLASTYKVQNESLTIDPLTSSISFSRSESNCVDNQPNTAVVPEDGSYQFVYCIDSDYETPQNCELEYQVINKTYRGEVSKTGEENPADFLVGKIRSELLAGQKGLRSFNASYNADAESVTFDATFKIDGLGNPIHVPTDVIVNKYALVTRTEYDGPMGDITVGSVNGSVFVANPIDMSPLDVNTSYDSSAMIDVAKGVCDGPTTLSTQTITYDDVEGGISYNYGFSEGSGPDDGVPVVDGVSGLSEWRVQMKPPLRQYEVIPNLNCEDLILDLGYSSRGEISITTIAVSGSGYDFSGVARQKGEDMLNTMANNRSRLQITKEDIDVDDQSATYTFSASYEANSIIEDGNTVLSLR